MATKKQLQEQKERIAKVQKAQVNHAAYNSSRTPSKGETNRGSGVKKSNLVPIKDKNQSVDKSKLQSIKTKGSTVDKSKLQSIKTVTPEYRKSRLEPIKSVEKKPNKTKTKRK